MVPMPVQDKRLHHLYWQPGCAVLWVSQLLRTTVPGVTGIAPLSASAVPSACDGHPAWTAVEPVSLPGGLSATCKHHVWTDGLHPHLCLQVRLLLLATMSGEHILLIGPPGTAKSEVGRRLNKLINGTYFERLLTRFSVPEVRSVTRHTALVSIDL